MSELKPCPFCGGEARRIDIDATKPSVPDAGASYIACGRCYACSPIMFGEKTGLEESWNRRAALATIDPDAKVVVVQGGTCGCTSCPMYPKAPATAHDDAIRRECADKAVLWQAKLCREDDWSCQMCTECNQLRAAILGKEGEIK